jgi:hypothetical protein
VIAALAFRGALWALVGASESSAGSGQFAALLAISAATAFLLVLVLETGTRQHSTGVG